MHFSNFCFHHPIPFFSNDLLTSLFLKTLWWRWARYIISQCKTLNLIIPAKLLCCVRWHIHKFWGLGHGHPQGYYSACYSVYKQTCGGGEEICIKCPILCSMVQLVIVLPGYEMLCWGPGILDYFWRLRERVGFTTPGSGLTLALCIHEILGRRTDCTDWFGRETLI